MYELSHVLGVKIVHLVDQADLFKISSLVYGGREIVLSVYNSLQGQRQFMTGIVNYQDCVVSVKIHGLGEF